MLWLSETVATICILSVTPVVEDAVWQCICYVVLSTSVDLSRICTTQVHRALVRNESDKYMKNIAAVIYGYCSYRQLFLASQEFMVS